ncbi:procathepsin L-like [Hemicordylus capensis]|uniref:procathepsin L-like n=1 Tax=Hemicordylus capensis TaxID=884348 RepID=UPI0023045638|nr:procathepsin L-like [Hemicordylus capensis]
MDKDKLSISVAAMIWLVLLRSFSTALNPALEGAWNDWKSTHAKVYSEGEEEAFRRGIWEKNLVMIEYHNQEASLGKHTYRMGMNQFGDLTQEEFTQQMNGFHPDLASVPNGKVPVFHESTTLETPKSLDWREHGYVTPVKNQGRCGSCWAFSATGALEALHFNKTGKLISLSEQNLLDCSWKQGNHGCQGGLMDSAFQYVIDNKGINSECTYPYEGKERRCRFKAWDRAATCTSFVNIIKGGERTLEQVVATVGPVSIAVNADLFQFYISGIFKGCSKKLGQLNHAMLAVGYGTSKIFGKRFNYWILKNSWDTTWGEGGYMRLAKGSNNQCGVATHVSFPI